MLFNLSQKFVSLFISLKTDFNSSSRFEIRDSRFNKTNNVFISPYGNYFISHCHISFYEGNVVKNCLRCFSKLSQISHQTNIDNKWKTGKLVQTKLIISFFFFLLFTSKIFLPLDKIIKKNLEMMTIMLRKNRNTIINKCLSVVS